MTELLKPILTQASKATELNKNIKLKYVLITNSNEIEPNPWVLR